MQTEKDIRILRILKDYWFIVLFVIQFIYMTAYNTADHTLFAREITELQSQVKVTETTLADIRSRLASIDTNLEYLKRSQK